MLAQAAGMHYRRRLSVTVERNGSVTVLMLSEPNPHAREERLHVWVRRRLVESGGFEGTVARTSEIHVTPFIGVIPATVGLRADPKEVAAIFFVPMSALEDPSYRGTYRFRRDTGQVSEHPAIFYNDQVIWGLTLRFTEEVLHRMNGAAPH
jgi:hypothetical protein